MQKVDNRLRKYYRQLPKKFWSRIYRRSCRNAEIYYKIQNYRKMKLIKL